MSDYFESHEAYQDRIDAMHEAGEFVPEYDNPRGPRRPLYPCKWVDNEWVRLTDEEIEEEKRREAAHKRREAERLRREREAKLIERKVLELNLLRVEAGPYYWTKEEKEEFFRRAWILWDKEYRRHRDQESFFRRSWELTQEAFDEDGNEIPGWRF